MQISHIIQREVHQICSTKYGASCLRNLSQAAVSSFSWKSVVDELRKRTPVLYATLKAALTRPRMRVDVSALGITAAVLLKCRNKFLSQAQAVISVLLYAGHCSKQVCVNRSNVLISVYQIAYT